MSKGDISVMNTDTRGHEIREPWSDSELARRINRRYRHCPGLISTAPFMQMTSGALGMTKGARPLLSHLQRLWMPIDRDGWPHVSYVWHRGMYGIGATPYQAGDMPVNMPMDMIERPSHPWAKAPSRLQTRITATGKAQVGSAQIRFSPWTRDRVMQKKVETITAPVLSPVRDRSKIHIPQVGGSKAKDLPNRPLSAISPEPHNKATGPITFTPPEDKTADKTTGRTAQIRRASIKGQTSGKDDTSWPMIPQAMDLVTPQSAHYGLISHFWMDTIQPVHSMPQNTGAHHTDPMPLAKNTKATDAERPSKTPAHVIMKSASGTSPAQSHQRGKPAQQEDMTVTEVSSSPNTRSYLGQASDGHRDVIGSGTHESGVSIPNISDTAGTGHDLQKGVINSHASRILDMPLTLSPKRRGVVGQGWTNAGTTAIQRMNAFSRTEERPSYTPALSYPSRMVRPRPLSSCTEPSERISTGKTPRTTYITPKATSRTPQLTDNRRVSPHVWHMDHTSALSEPGRTMQPFDKLSSDVWNPFLAQTSTSPDMPLAPPHSPSYAGRGNFSPFGPTQAVTCSNPSTMVQRAGSEAMDISAVSAHDQGLPDISSEQDGSDTRYGSQPSWQGQDVEEIASRVYAMIEQRLIIERESLGLD